MPIQDRYTRSFTAALENTGYFRITHPAAPQPEAERLITRGAVAFVITIPPDFGRRLQRGDRPQTLIELLPLTHLLRLVSGVMLKGAHLSNIAPVRHGGGPWRVYPAALS